MNYCRATLQEIDAEGFSAKGRRALADGRHIPYRLDFTRKDLTAVHPANNQRRTLSVSWVQEKIGLALIRGRFVLAEKDSTYILKPIPSSPLFAFREDIPADEHVTMQIASQLCGIRTAANACVLLADGEPAYLTRRFDYREGEKFLQEDFCQLLGRTEETHGPHYKYDGSYEEIALAIRQFCPAHPVEVPKFFRLVVFNYLFSNGDAHLKNFSIYPSSAGDPILTPAYDLLNTSMLVPGETPLALRLFANEDFYTPAFERLGFYSRSDFEVLGARIGLGSELTAEILRSFSGIDDGVRHLVARSFLSEAAKREYIRRYEDRKRALETIV